MPHFYEQGLAFDMPIFGMKETKTAVQTQPTQQTPGTQKNNGNAAIALLILLIFAA